MEVLAERQPYLLFDRMVAFHIQRGLAVPLSAPEFYQGLRQRFLESDGMVFTPLQRGEYDKRRMQAAGVAQLALFVNDERSAMSGGQRNWPRKMAPALGTTRSCSPSSCVNCIRRGTGRICPNCALCWRRFLQHEDGRCMCRIVSARRTWSGCARRTCSARSLASICAGRGRLRTFRSEAIRAGFSDAWKRRDYGVIVQVAERLPSPVIEEDANLLMYMDNARLRLGQEPQQVALF